MDKELVNLDQPPAVSILVRGAEKTFENAESLYREAEILRKAAAPARAFCLHQFSLEECSKIENLAAWAVGLLLGDQVDQKKVLAAFARHSAKNKTNAYMLERSEAEKDAKARGDWKAALNEFKKFQLEFHEKSNDAKNASLYVDWIDGEFVAPKERITKEVLTEISERNQFFLGYAHNGLRMLQRLEKTPEEMRDLFVDFVESAEKLREEKPDDPLGAMNELLSRFLDVGRHKRKS